MGTSAAVVTGIDGAGYSVIAIHTAFRVDTAVYFVAAVNGTSHSIIAIFTLWNAEAARDVVAGVQCAGNTIITAQSRVLTAKAQITGIGRAILTIITDREVYNDGATRSITGVDGALQPFQPRWQD